MNERILRIEECSFKINKDNYDCFDGYEIVTDKQSIKLGISNSQSYCETWGYFITNDDVNDFIGAEIINISLTDTSLNSKFLDKLDLYNPNLMFININTNKGLLQFTAYNEHNGYYGHDAIVISNQLNHREQL